MDLRKRKAVDDLNIKRYPKRCDPKRNSKRKAVDDLNNVMKIMKLIELTQKRKMCYNDTHCKKQRTCKCIVHEEKYICDIYECNGKINRDNFICK